MSSIKDVAKAAGVSYTTVSHVLNRTRPVSDATRIKVEEAIARLGYVPNRNARGLRTGSSRTIGVVGTDPSDYFFNDVMSHAAGRLSAEGYRMEFAFAGYGIDGRTFNEGRGEEIAALEGYMFHGIDAVILNTGRNDTDLGEALARLGKPCILFQRRMTGEGCCGVTSDDFAGGYAAAEHLLSIGCRRIGVISGFAYRSHSVTGRIHGIRAAMEEAGTMLPGEYRIRTMYGVNEAYEGTRALMALAEPPDGIICYSDTMAMAAIRALEDLGIKVPDDVSVVGWDDIQLAGYSVPRLTTIRQGPVEMGRLIADKTLESITLGRSAESPEPLPVELVIRESTRAQVR